MLNRLHTQEEDFKLQNKTLLDEIAIVSDTRTMYNILWTVYMYMYVHTVHCNSNSYLINIIYSHVHDSTVEHILMIRTT